MKLASATEEQRFKSQQLSSRRCTGHGGPGPVLCHRHWLSILTRYRRPLSGRHDSPKGHCVPLAHGAVGSLYAFSHTQPLRPITNHLDPEVYLLGALPWSEVPRKLIWGQLTGVPSVFTHHPTLLCHQGALLGASYWSGTFPTGCQPCVSSPGYRVLLPISHRVPNLNWLLTLYMYFRGIIPNRAHGADKR